MYRCSWEGQDKFRREKFGRGIPNSVGTNSREINFEQGKFQINTFLKIFGEHFMKVIEFLSLMGKGG